MRFRIALIPASVAALAGSSCPPDVTSIEIVPTSVILGDPAIGTTFELEARLWEKTGADRRSIIVSDGHTPTWKVSQTWLKHTGSSGFRARFEVQATPTVDAVVTVKADGKTSPPADILLPPSGGVPQDQLTAAAPPALPPDVAVVSGGRSTAGAPCVSTPAFVKRSMLGQVLKPCDGELTGWLAVLARGHRMLMTPVAWTAPPPIDAIDATGLQQPVLSLPVALRVMVYDGTLNDPGLTALRDKVLETAKIDLAAANDILADARAGIQLTLTSAHTLVGTLTSKYVVKDCPDGDTKQVDEPDLINIYYVDTLETARATTCGWHESRRQDVIYVGRKQRVSNTLMHEVGHALGLTVPRDGHTEVMREFDLTNVMMCCDVDQDRLARTRLTVGQVFRMNADSASWLNWARVGGAAIRQGPRAGCQCGKDDPTGPCPRLAEDVAAPNSTAEVIYTRDCFDRLVFQGVPGESPAAIVAGRRWRTPPALPGDPPPPVCRPDLPGDPETQFGVGVRFPNLVRPGTCDSWAVVFFKDHGVLHLELDETTYRPWTQSAEQRLVPAIIPIPPRSTVTVNLHYHAGHQSTINADKQHMLATFVESNRTGILLELNEMPVPDTTLLSCPAPAPAEFNLCYLDGTALEGDANPNARLIKLWLGQHQPSSASHFLGQALNLDALSPLPGDRHQFDDNIMLQNHMQRGQKLTLGQVYRINDEINPNLPDCSATPRKCPPLYAPVEQ